MPYVLRTSSECLGHLQRIMCGNQCLRCQRRQATRCASETTLPIFLDLPRASWHMVGTSGSFRRPCTWCCATSLSISLPALTS